MEALLKKHLSGLPAVSLPGINELAFLNRFDTKFPLSAHRLPSLFDLLDESYLVLEIDGRRAFSYTTTYYDTPGYTFFAHHHQGKRNRYKLRYRRYKETQDEFLEIKHKNNKGKTIKYRIPSRFEHKLGTKAREFVSAVSAIRPAEMAPKLTAHFSRASLVSFRHQERITLDYNITFSELDTGKTLDLPYLAICELKNERYGNKSRFYKTMRSHGFHPRRFSKYCTGMGLLRPELKQNRFKSTQLFLEKLETQAVSPLNPSYYA